MLLYDGNESIIHDENFQIKGISIPIRNREFYILTIEVLHPTMKERKRPFLPIKIDDYGMVAYYDWLTKACFSQINI